MSVHMAADVRWQCGGCGRFIAEKDVHSADFIDPGEYYGVRSEVTADCESCGRIDYGLGTLRLVTVREYPVYLSDEPVGGAS